MDRCYIDGHPCDCGAYDVLHDGCPRDEYGHEEDQDYSDCDLDDIEFIHGENYGEEEG